jgi:hypothetical protein
MNTSDESTRPVEALEEGAGQRGLLTPSEFADRVMSAIAVAPLPTPTRTFLAAIRARAWREAFAALTVAWHLSTVRRWHVAPRVRARSFALVLAVTAVLGTGSLVAAAAINQFVPVRIERVPAPMPAGSGVQERHVDGVRAIDPSGPNNDADESLRPVDGSGEPDDEDDPIGGAEPDEADDVDEADDADENEPGAGDDRTDRDDEEDDDSSGGADDPDDDRDEDHPSDTSDADDDSGVSDESDGTDSDDDSSTDADADDDGFHD